MEVIIYTLRTVSTALLDSLNLLMLIMIGIMFYFSNKKISIIQKMTIGESLDSPLELTLSQIVLGIVIGAVGSLILFILGITFNENSGIEIILMITVLGLFYKQRFIKIPYTGALLGLVSIILLQLNKYIDTKIYINLDIENMVILVGIMYLLEGLLIIIDGDKGAIPVFTNKDDRIIGGFSFNRMWPLPIALLILFNESTLGVSEFISPNWWPLLNNSKILSVIATGVLIGMPFYAMSGYTSVTFTKNKKRKKIESGAIRIIYGGSLIVVSYIATLGFVGQIITLAYMSLIYELIIKFEMKNELEGKSLYVSDDEGITILEVAPSSPAYKAGIRRGDKVISVNNQNVQSEIDILKIAKDSIFEIAIKIKKEKGSIVEYLIRPKNKRLGILLVPKFTDEKIIKVNPNEIKKIIEDLKNKKE